MAKYNRKEAAAQFRFMAGMLKEEATESYMRQAVDYIRFHITAQEAHILGQASKIIENFLTEWPLLHDVKK